MIGIFIIALLVFGLAMTGMAVGILAGRGRMGMGCAGSYSPEDDVQECGICGRPADTGCGDSTTVPPPEAGVK